MTAGDRLIGTDQAADRFAQEITRVMNGHGGIVLLRGETGVGKTSLARSALAAAGLDRVSGFGAVAGTVAYGPVVEALRGLSAQRPSALAGVSGPGSALGAIMPELGSGPGPADDGALFEAIRSVLARTAAERPLALLFDDMQWADEATLTMLPALARAFEHAPVLLLVVYRDDELSETHPVRRLRAELRRDQRLSELSLAPLDPAATQELLAQSVGGPPSARLSQAIFARSGGVPFFVAELGSALVAGAHLRQGPDGWELLGDDLPLPENARDAVLLRAVSWSTETRALVDVAAVFGQAFDVNAVMAITGVTTWPDALLDRGVVVARGPGQMAFRHALVRDAFYQAVTWTRRAELHRRVAQWMHDHAAPARVTGEHWALAGERERARASFLAAVDDCCAVHAYHDGMRAATRALELTENGCGDRDGAPLARLDALARLAACAEAAGEPAEAARCWQEIALGWGAGDPWRCGQAWRRRAGSLELQGLWQPALAAREAAADAFVAVGAFAEAASERLAAAAHLRSATSFRAALGMVELARGDARAAQRPDLLLRIQALEGNVHARMGDGSRGVALVRQALAAALDANLSAEAAEIYQRLADSLEHHGDYPAARATYDDAAAFCQTNGADSTAQLCLACLAVILGQTGDWERAVSLARQVLASPTSIAHAQAAAGCTLGVIEALRGDLESARAQLLDTNALARRIELTAAELLCAWGLAVVERAGPSPERAAESCHAILSRWERSEDRHYAVSPLRWATTVFAELDDGAGARSCAAALTQIAVDCGTPAAMSALAHANAETSMLDGDAAGAAVHFERATILADTAGGVFEQMESGRRLGVALLEADRQPEAVDQLLQAYRLARRLRARPSIQRLAIDLAQLGERVDRRLSRLQADQLGHEQLTRREVEVIGLLAAGATNREIAARLVLSVRTVDMHVRNILRKLDCRSRVDATRRAGELGLTPVTR